MSKNVQKLPVPHPVSINEVCSECGEMWALHPEGATLVDCVRLLKAKPSTTFVSSPCNCWCHHSGTTAPYPWWGTITVSNTDLPYPNLPALSMSALSGTSHN